MTPEERDVIQKALGLRYAEMANDFARVRRGEGQLRTATQRLMESCPRCNAGGHTCPGCGKSISHVDVDCGDHYDPRNAGVIDQEDFTVTLKPAYPCPNCIVDDEDPAVWCDCRDDERCRAYRPCRKRAHDPSRCPNRPTCGAIPSDMFNVSGPCTHEPHGPETFHSWQEDWVIACWRYVRNGDRVRLGGHEATVETSSLNDWHVDPNSNPKYPKAWGHSECTIRLAGRDPLTFDPAGQVEILMDAERQAIHNLMQAFSVQVIQ